MSMSINSTSEPEVWSNSGKRKSKHHLARYRQVAFVLVKYRLDDLIKILGLERFLPFHRLPPSFRRQTLSKPVRTRMALEELGTTFVKLGQILSTRTDILPRDFIQELSKLQNALKPIDFEVMKRLIKEELGKSVDEIFTSLDPVAIGVASIGQVHAGILKDGREVVIKVRKPGVYEQVREDIEILRQLAGTAQDRWEGGEQYQLIDIVDEVAEALMAEMDYNMEGHNCEYFADFFKNDSSVHIPQVLWEYTTTRVITMERLHGVGFLDIELWSKNGDRKQMSERVFGLWTRMVFYGDIFHADPHPGNLLVEPDGRLALLDFGMIGITDDDVREGLASIVSAIVTRDVDLLIDSLVEMGAVSHGSSLENLRKGMKHVMGHFRQLSLSQTQINSGLGELLTVIRHNNVKLPSNTFLLLKTMGMAQALGRGIDPEFDVLRVLEPDVRKVVRKKHSPRAILNQLPLIASNLANLGVSFPPRLDRFMRSIERGDLQFRTDVSGLERHLEHMERLVNRLMIGFIVAAGLVIAAIAFLFFQLWFKR
jgi:ubiquinone biosynthesis protein